MDNIELLAELQKKINDGDLRITLHTSFVCPRSGHREYVIQDLKVSELKEVNGKITIETR
jgi:hypothetical protein